MDIIFERFLADGYDTLDASQRSAFDALLDEADQDIYAWLMEQDTPTSLELGQLVAIIRGTSLPNPL